MKECKKEGVEKIAAELYKMLSKYQKEANADPMIEEIMSGGAASASGKKKETVMDFDTLKNQIETFLQYVDNGYYYEPNRVVSKAKRSKWRFEVKNYIKMINEIPVDGENGAESARLLRGIYKRLAYGCGYYIFSSEDPFQSVGIRQPDFYDMLVRRTFSTGFTDENLKNMLKDATTVFIDRNSLHIEMEAIYANALPATDLKYKAIAFIKEYVESYEAEIKTDTKRSHDEYYLKTYIEEMCETLLLISISLCEPEEAVAFYWQHVHDSRPELTLYKLLDTIGSYGDDKLWISVYEEGLQKGIQPRDTLEMRYRKLKKGNKRLFLSVPIMLYFADMFHLIRILQRCRSLYRQHRVSRNRNASVKLSGSSCLLCVQQYL